MIKQIFRPAIAHGWVRHVDYDTPEYDAWERPSGEIKLVAKGVIPNVMTLIKVPAEDEG